MNQYSVLPVAHAHTAPLLAQEAARRFGSAIGTGLRKVASYGASATATPFVLPTTRPGVWLHIKPTQQVAALVIDTRALDENETHVLLAPHLMPTDGPDVHRRNVHALCHEGRTFSLVWQLGTSHRIALEKVHQHIRMPHPDLPEGAKRPAVRILHSTNPFHQRARPKTFTAGAAYHPNADEMAKTTSCVQRVSFPVIAMAGTRIVLTALLDLSILPIGKKAHQEALLRIVSDRTSQAAINSDNTSNHTRLARMQRLRVMREAITAW